MTLSYKDINLDFDNKVFNTKFLQIIFSNLILTSLCLTILLILIFEINKKNKIARFIYSYLSTFVILLITVKTIKREYKEQSKSDIENNFSDMMTNNQANANIIQKIPNTIFGSRDVKEHKEKIEYDDIEKFLS